jgi:hypothetical protein
MDRHCAGKAWCGREPPDSSRAGPRPSVCQAADASGVTYTIKLPRACQAWSYLRQLLHHTTHPHVISRLGKLVALCCIGLIGYLLSQTRTFAPILSPQLEISAGLYAQRPSAGYLLSRAADFHILPENFVAFRPHVGTQPTGRAPFRTHPLACPKAPCQLSFAFLSGFAAWCSS